ncbi:MAG: hypothetical protein KA500_02575 [Rhodoluna sp.]|nr:hypothetical protein [Rhodoluna sp.]MBP6186615.1 hypothetical protein [Rhodoluna sp.]
MSNSIAQLFGQVLKQGAILIAAIALIGGVIGWFVASTAGLLSALIGAGMALVFVSMTALSVWLGGRLSLGGFFGVVMGGWIVKLVGFIVFVAVLKSATFIVGPILFGCVVASVLGSLALDAVAVMRARIPTVGSN